MRRQYHRWWSPSLGKDMELLEFGHGGAKVIVYPSSMGKYYEWEDRGMIAALRHKIEQGWFHLFCVDTVDKESWYADWKHPGGRIWRHHQYDQYVLNEVLPLADSRNGTPYTITTGASFGGYHAMDFGLRHPGRVNRVVSMSGMCDVSRFADGYYNDLLYYHNPVDFIPGEHDWGRLNALRSMDIIMAIGKDDRLLHQNRELSGKLWAKGIGNALREWDGFSHDWPWWHRMINMYIGGHD
jgi:esterase/lipase superfamily enzyme